MGTPDWTTQLRDNVTRIRAGIAAAAQRTGRDPATVRLVAVTKYVSPEVLRQVVAAGVVDIGESRPQQLVARARDCGPALFGWPNQAGDATDHPRWHLIGHLQRNKIKLLLPLARIIHSLDSPRLAETLALQAQRLDVAVDVFLEVNLAGEASKDGATPDTLPALAETVLHHPELRLRGLMTMAPFNPDPEAARPHFARLRKLLQELRGSAGVGPTCEHLSMGMSQDYAVAVEEGATFVRVGSALFEGLPAQDPRGH